MADETPAPVEPAAGRTEQEILSNVGGDSKGFATTPVAAESDLVAPEVPAQGETAPTPSEVAATPTGVKDEATDYADRAIEIVTSAAVRAHDLTAEGARALHRALKDALERVERVVHQHDDAAQ